MEELICKRCGYKLRDEETIREFKKKFEGTELHDIPYLCGACQNFEEFLDLRRTYGPNS